MNRNTALGLAAQAWCAPETSHVVIQPELAVEFANILQKRDEFMLDLLDRAWGIIANTGGGNWETQSAEWQGAAEKWRDKWHEVLAENREEPSQIHLPLPIAEELAIVQGGWFYEGLN